MRMCLLTGIAILIWTGAASAAADDSSTAGHGAKSRFDVTRGQLIRTPDGANISVMIVKPRTAAKLTTLLGFTIYANDDWSLADAVKMADRGYAGVVAYTRGKGESRDTIIPYEHDGADAAAVIEWIAGQEWSDGRVGMYGGSYNSFTQWSAAKRMPKALQALATSASNAPGIDTPAWNGVFQNFFYSWPFFTTTNRSLDETGYGEQGRWSGLFERWYRKGLSYRRLPELDRVPNPFFSKWLRHPHYDDYWKSMTPQGQEFSKINIPVLAVTGYFDGGMVGALHYLREHTTNNRKANHRLLVGPYDHFAMQRGVAPEYEGYRIDPVAQIDLQELRLSWFDHIFRGRPIPEILKDNINYQLMGSNSWQHARSIYRTGKPTRYFLDSCPMAGRESVLAMIRPPRACNSTTSVDFSRRDDLDLFKPSRQVQERLELATGVAFASPKSVHTSAISGLFKAHLTFKSNKADFDFELELYQRMPDGKYFRLARSIYRASHVNGSSSSRTLLPKNRWTTIDVQSDQFMGRQIEAGSQLVAVLRILKSPDYQINYGTGRDVSDESIADAKTPLVVNWSSSSWISVSR